MLELDTMRRFIESFQVPLAEPLDPVGPVGPVFGIFQSDGRRSLFIDLEKFKL
jgi:hypothetical protein